MAKDAQGLWTVTTDPLEPDLYGYRFLVDGLPLIDPADPNMKPNLLDVQNVVHVPGTALPWEMADVPHGTLHRHFYTSALVGDKRDFYVYTPPGFDPRSKTKYPVLYLLHGYSDDAGGWTAIGQAHVILDNLIAAGKVKPMIVVMPLGYGAPEILLNKWNTFNNRPELRQRNLDRFRESLLTEVMPMAEKAYPISGKREDHAIAGLSMGGADSLYTGLNNVDKFAWIGAFSSGGLNTDFAGDFPNIASKDTSRIKLLWIACGTDDRLITPNRDLITWLRSKDVKLTPIETPGAHTWMVWRRNLAEFAPLLFR
jgi:enterochelin esterase-like enzyme